MSAPPTNRRSATDIGYPLALGWEARHLLPQFERPIDYLTQLIERREYPDAVRFMAYALETREAVWWACLCAKHAGRGLSPREHEALRTAVSWVLDPSEENRQAAVAAAEAVGTDLPAGCAAQSAAWCNDTYDVRAAKIAGAGVLTAVFESPADRRVAYQQCLLIGLDVFDGTAHWLQPEPPGKE